MSFAFKCQRPTFFATKALRHKAPPNHLYVFLTTNNTNYTNSFLFLPSAASGKPRAEFGHRDHREKKENTQRAQRNNKVFLLFIPYPPQKQRETTNHTNNTNIFFTI